MQIVFVAFSLTTSVMTENVHALVFVIFSYIYIVYTLVLAVVGIESTLFKVMLDDAYNDIVSDFNVGLMEQWFVKIAPDGKRFFTSTFFSSTNFLGLDGLWVDMLAYLNFFYV